MLLKYKNQLLHQCLIDGLICKEVTDSTITLQKQENGNSYLFKWQHLSRTDPSYLQRFLVAKKNILIFTNNVTLNAEKRLRKNGFSYVDSVGNYSIKTPKGEWFHRVDRATMKTKPMTRNYYSPDALSSGLIFRFLLQTSDPLAYRQIALRAGVSLGQTCNVIHFLEQELNISRPRSPFFLYPSEKAALLVQWKTKYQEIALMTQKRFFSPLSHKELIERLRQHPEYGFYLTGSTAKNGFSETEDKVVYLSAGHPLNPQVLNQLSLIEDANGDICIEKASSYTLNQRFGEASVDEIEIGLTLRN